MAKLQDKDFDQVSGGNSNNNENCQMLKNMRERVEKELEKKSGILRRRKLEALLDRLDETVGLYAMGQIEGGEERFNLACKTYNALLPSID